MLCGGRGRSASALRATVPVSPQAASLDGWSGARPTLSPQRLRRPSSPALTRIPREATSSAAAVLRLRFGPTGAGRPSRRLKTAIEAAWAASRNSQERRQWLRSAASPAVTTAASPARSAPSTSTPREPNVTHFALHGDDPAEPVLGRLVRRGLHDELKGTTYAIIDGVDGRTHHLVFSDLEITGDAEPGAIVETRAYDDAAGRKRLSLATRSDLPIEAQVSSPGATWLDRKLLATQTALSCAGFGAEVREAMDRRIDHLVEQDLARRQGQRVIFGRDLLTTLRRRELDAAAARLAAETGLSCRPSAEGEHVSGVYRRRVTLASGRFAMVDDVMGFQLVPWRPALEQQLGRQVTGVMAPGGNVDWNFGRKRGIGI